MKIKFDKFVLAIMAVVLLAYMFPEFGSMDAAVAINRISTIGIGLIFFFYGLKLSPEKLKAGLRNWRLHVLIQLTTFLIFPALVLFFRPFAQTLEQESYWLAFFFLAALPSTVSTSVVMVSMANGNVPAAIFNASISGIIGILITPLWIGHFVQHMQVGFDFTEIYTSLVLQVFLPVFFGVLLQRYFGDIMRRHASKLTFFDKSIILLILYKSFAQSFHDNIFGTVSLSDILLLYIGVLVMFFSMFFLTGFLSTRMGFSVEDRITAQFCGTKKSLVHGTVFSKILFGNMISQGILLLPLMLFHVSQIIIVSAIASLLKGPICVESKEE